MKFTNLRFAPLVLLFLFFGFSKPLAAKEEDPVYNDTVDIIDFLVSVYKEEPTYFQKSIFNDEYVLENCVIITKHFIPDSIKTAFLVVSIKMGYLGLLPYATSKEG